MILISSITVGTGILAFIAGLLIKSFGGAASAVLADEFKASAPQASQRIIRLAARRVPEAVREDVLETWLAEASEYENRPLKALRFAIVNCLAAAPSLARELRPAPQVASAGQTSKRRMPSWGETRTAIKKARGRLAFLPIRSPFLGELFQRWTNTLAGALVLLAEIVKPTKDTVEAIARLSTEQVRLLGGVVAGLGEMARAFFELLGPYDYSREWRSVAQLAARILAMALALPVLLGLLFFLLEGPLGL